MNGIGLQRSRVRRGLAGASAAGLLVFQLHAAAAAGYVTVRALGTGGARGTRVPFSVVVGTGGLPVAGIQNDIAYSSVTPIAATSAGKPDCTVNPNISGAGRMTLSAAFRPSGCTGAKCTSARLILVPEGMNVFDIPDGATLYTCRINIAPTAALGTYPIVVSEPGASNQAGLQLAAVGVNGSVSVTR
jgi:acyl-CoA reductase-like NAD-dependent aldehyde dehydrogenase